MLARFLAALTGMLLVPTMMSMVPAEAAKRPEPIRATISDVAQGGFTVIKGQTVRAPRPVRIQQHVPPRKIGGKWVRWVAVSGEFIKRNGQFSIRVFPPAKVGTYTYRAKAPRWQGRRAWTSKQVKIRVVQVGVNPDTAARNIPVTPEAAPSSTTRALDWGRTDTFSAMTGLTSTDCAADNFCVVGSETGKVFIDTRTGTVGASQLGTSPIVGISCTDTDFCMAVDKVGKAYRYNGTEWWGPTSINQGHVTTGVSCSSENLCVAVDQEGYGIPYVEGTWWSRRAGSVDGTPANGGFSNVSCGPGAIACAITSPAGITLFVFTVNNSGQNPSFTRQFTPWSPEADRPDLRGTLTSVSCPTTAACTVAHTNGQATLIDPTGFLGILPDFTSIDYRSDTGTEPNKKAVVGCRAEDSCLILDNKGELYAGNNFLFGWNYGPIGTVLTGAQEARDFSCPLGAAEACVLIASDGMHRITN
jgi:hypothetical protein